MTRLEKISNVVPAKHGGENFWEPLTRVRSEFDHLMDDFWTRPMSLNMTRRLQALSVPALELKEKETEFELVAEIPGMKAEDVELKVSDGILRLSGERREDRDEKKEGFLFSERRYGCFERAIELPQGIDHGKITATARDGILSVHMPKSPAAIERERKIPINS